MPTAQTLDQLHQLQRELHARLRGVDDCIHRIGQLLEGLEDVPPLLTTDWDELASCAEALDILSISSTTLNRYRGGRVPQGRPAFPSPVRFKGRSPYWRREDLIRWSCN